MQCDICSRDNLTDKELEMHIKVFHGKVDKTFQQPQQMTNGACQECGATLWYESGCVHCRSCGYEKC